MTESEIVQKSSTELVILTQAEFVKMLGDGEFTELANAWARRNNRSVYNREGTDRIEIRPVYNWKVRND